MMKVFLVGFFALATVQASAVGALGEKAQYFVIGDQSQAAEGILNELKVDSSASILTDQMHVEGIKILDTTSPQLEVILKKLVFAPELLSDSNNYNITQSLGNAARQSGFEAIIVAAARGRYKNLVLFK